MPLITRIVCVVEVGVVAWLLVLFMPPAWAAAIAIPITDRIIISLDDVANFVIAIGVAVGLWKSWKSERAAVAAAADAAQGRAKIEAVSIQIDGLLAARDIAKIDEGEKKGRQAGEDAAEQLAEGQRQGRETERASAAAKGAPPNGVAAAEGKAPLPVADDRTATAGERVADATERAAKATERSAIATEEKK